MNPLSSDGDHHGNQHLQNKQMAESLAEDFILLLLAAVVCVCTKKGLYQKRILTYRCWITETQSWHFCSKIKLRVRHPLLQQAD